MQSLYSNDVMIETIFVVIIEMKLQSKINPFTYNLGLSFVKSLFRPFRKKLNADKKNLGNPSLQKEEEAVVVVRSCLQPEEVKAVALLRPRILSSLLRISSDLLSSALAASEQHFVANSGRIQRLEFHCSWAK